MNKKCTEADYRLFVKECKKWIKEFGLTDWQVYFEKVDMENYGHCLLNGKDRTVTIAFCKEWGEQELRPKTREEISRTAFHEVLHVVVYGLEYLADSRHVSRNEISEAAEALVVRLTNFYFNRG